MKLHIFGTCAGTEPMPNRQHVSFAAEINDAIYWFDAGEGCARTAHLMGVDLLNVRKIFISHTHMDHVGGLANLFWYIRKLCSVRNALPHAKEIELYIPVLETWEGIQMILSNTEGGFKTGFNIVPSPVKEGMLCDDENLGVIALENSHLEPLMDGRGRSFSFGIKSKDKYIVYSGDVGEPRDLDPLIGRQCDALLMETGHHKIADVCSWANGKSIKNLFFIHNGREILQDRESAEMAASEFKGVARILEDRDIIEL